jgi:hypothetical protein
LVERQAVTLSVVETCQVDQIEEQFVAAPGLEDGTGQAQSDGAIASVEELRVMEQVVGCVCDTTRSNTGHNIGFIRLLEDYLDRQILKLLCFRHIVDLLAKNAALVVWGRRTTGPGDTVFLRYKREWSEVKDQIDYTALRQFPQATYRGTYLDEVREDVVMWSNHALAAKTFGRNHYNYLVQLINIYLTGIVPRGWKFGKPQTVSPSRFCQYGIYYLTLALLLRMLDWLTPVQRIEVDKMAIITSLFYGPLFLRSYLSSCAPFNTLSSIYGFKRLRGFPEFRAAADSCLKTWSNHLNYITPQLIVFSLVNEDLSDEGREGLAQALVAQLENSVGNATRSDRISWSKLLHF